MEPELSSDRPTMAKLKVAGTWSGVLEVELETWTIPMLRAEVARRSNCEPTSIKLISGGKILKDGEGNEKLSDLGIKINAKILSIRVSVDEGNTLRRELMAEEDRSRELARIKAAAVALAKRHTGGSLPVEDFNLELENQSGQKVNLGCETDQRGVMMGLMLHANAKHLIKEQKYQDALDVLTMGEEAFSFCDPKVLEMVDNVSILQIDMVWCYFMLRDITWLSMASVRLARAREGLERSHGKDSSRFRTLQAGRYPEIALYLRLDLLEGVVTYYSNQFEKSRKAFTSAQARYLQLQVPDESLSLLLSMGYEERDVKRALRMNNQNLESAIEFLVEEEKRKARRREEDIRQRKEIREQRSYGTTPLKKAVDLQRLNELVSIGFEKELAAEALRRNENDAQKALDDLTNPKANCCIQLYIASRKRKRQVDSAAVEELASLGYERSKVVAALRASGTKEQALTLLTVGSMPDSTVANDGSSASAVSVQNNEGSSSVHEGEEMGMEREVRDVEMENAIADELTGDPWSDYDIEITKEGEAITEYLALLASTGNN